MSEVQKDGAQLYDHLEVAARAGNQQAIEKLTEPEFPEALDYLWGWLMAVHRKSGVGMSGWLPLTYTTVADWSRLMDEHPAPDDVGALFVLDGILLAGARKADA